jgi:hypothetical protein
MLARQCKANLKGQGGVPAYEDLWGRGEDARAIHSQTVGQPARRDARKIDG